MRDVDVRAWAEAVFDDMVDTRRDLHSRPELSFEEHRTTRAIRDRLVGLGLGELARPTDTGAVFELDSGRPGHTVILRADIDALPVDEEVALPFSSDVPGVMHACGHDVHTAGLLGVAQMLQAHAEGLCGRYVFVFQPGEEKLCGAKAMIDGGLLDSIGDARVVGYHVTSLLPAGFVGVRAGIAMSEAHMIRISLHGVGGHGAVPLAAGNVVLAAGQLVGRLAAVAEGLTYERVECVCSAGVIQAGAAVNVVPRHAIIEGTLRTFTEDQRQQATTRLRELGEAIAAEFGVEVDVDLPEHTPAVVNDPAMAEMVEVAARTTMAAEQIIPLPPVAPSDDVSELLDRRAGCYFFVGGGLADGSSGMHHSSTFALDEEALRIGATVLASSAVAMARDGEPR